MCERGNRVFKPGKVGSFVCTPNLTVSLRTVASGIEVSRVSVLVLVLTFMGLTNLFGSAPRLVFTGRWGLVNWSLDLLCPC